MTAGAVTDRDVVLGFLADMAGRRISGALEALATDVVYTNVGLPTLRGRRQAARVLNLLQRPVFGFGVEVRSVAADGAGTVLTERVDELRFGPVRARFWVCGRFDVSDGRIILWRDYFDNIDVLKGVVRGIVALVVPAVQRPLVPFER
ncbi:limonene-1,2-epoxide hydrolase family protein [Tsukamurella soli]|uniref:Limonene-1,2-epoxide hydrolase family protein n=1 Tax=Tsukamurella soli TaxID=644556 RepID=A0ABP8J0K0_9ACTN